MPVKALSEEWQTIYVSRRPAITLEFVEQYKANVARLVAMRTRGIVIEESMSYADFRGFEIVR